MSDARLCATVTARTTAELRDRRDAVRGADLVELRVDSVVDPDAAGALAGRRLPVIVTCRPVWEGGHFAGSEEERRRLLTTAVEHGAEYVDVEARADLHDVVAARRGRGVVLSMHDFSGVPTDLAARATAMAASGAEVIKLAVTAHCLRDTLSLLALPPSDNRVVLAMGDAGVATRVLARRFRSCWTYAGDGVAPGQMPLPRMRDEFGFSRLSASTAVYGVIGRPIMHSLSPAMHNAAFNALRMDAVYLPLAAADFADFVAFAEGVPLAGVSVTAPFKLDAFAHAGHVDAAAERTGSVNTLRRLDTADSNAWEGCNTDVAGFLAPLRNRIMLPGCRATVMGAGGAARSAAAALVEAGAVTSIAGRDAARVAAAARHSQADVAAWPPAAGSWDLLVNATPVGTAPALDDSPLPDGPFTGRLVYDLVYNPRATRLLRDAGDAGCDTLGGLDMLVAQAERQFEWWTGVKPEAAVMRRAAENALHP